VRSSAGCTHLLTDSSKDDAARFAILHYPRQKKKHEAARKVQEETKLKLTALVGADRVAEYEKHRKGGATEIRD
jgi:hypothetical protein